MGLKKTPTEGGSGGKRGHSNMEHWVHTDEIKDAARTQRRIEDRKAVRAEGAVASGTSKEHARLASVEADLLHRLLQHLPAVAAGRDTLFFTTREFNPFARRVSTIGQQLAELALESLALREALSEPAEGSVGQMFRAALHESADVNDHHRLGPIRLAERLLAALHGRLATGG